MNTMHKFFGSGVGSADVVRRARIFAALHHERVGQLRKYTNEPYIVHPAAVVALVQRVPHTPSMLAAAWLHDVVEDTSATLDDVCREFGTDVAALVEMLTDVSTHADGNRAARKALDRSHTAKASAPAKTIKLADLIDNAGSILLHDPVFARVFLKEKALLLDVLQEGDATLLAMAREIVTNTQHTC